MASNLMLKIKEKRMKEPANESKWRRHIGTLSDALGVNRPEFTDYKKNLEYRQQNFRIIYGGLKRDEQSRSPANSKLSLAAKEAEMNATF